MAVKHASAPKAYINITGLGFAKLTKEGAELKYSDITKQKDYKKLVLKLVENLKQLMLMAVQLNQGIQTEKVKSHYKCMRSLKRFAKLF